MVVALAALFVALGGPAQAAKLIDGKQDPQELGDEQAGQGRHAEAARPLSAGAARADRDAGRDRSRSPSSPTNAVSTRALAPASVLTGTVADDTLTAADLGAELGRRGRGRRQRGRPVRDPQQRRRRLRDRRQHDRQRQDHRRQPLRARHRPPGRDVRVAAPRDRCSTSARSSIVDASASTSRATTCSPRRSRPGRTQLDLHRQRHRRGGALPRAGLQPRHARRSPGATYTLQLRRPRPARASTARCRRRPTRPRR